MATLNQIRAAIQIFRSRFNPVTQNQTGSIENLLVYNHWLDDRNVFLHRVCSDERFEFGLAILEEIGNGKNDLSAVDIKLDDLGRESLANGNDL